MKTIVISLFALLSVYSAFAQFDGSKPRIASDDQFWTFGFHYGIAQLSGDLNSKGYFAKLSGESKSSFSLNVSKQISSSFALKAEFGKSHFFCNSDSLPTPLDNTIHSLFSSSGDITEIGLYGIFNLNNLFDKNRSVDSKWNVYLSTGFGYATANTLLIDKVSLDSTAATKSMLIAPITIGLNYQLAEGLWLSVENSYRFANTHMLDGYYTSKYDKFTTTKVGLTFNIQKLMSGISKRKERGSSSNSRAVSSYSEPIYEPTTPIRQPKRSSVFKSAPRTLPEVIDYTGFNPMIPPPVIKKIPLNQNQSATGNNKDDNRWADPNNPGQFEITGVYNKKTAVDTLEVKKIKEHKFKGRTIKITRGIGPTGSSRSGVGAPVSRSVNTKASAKAIPVTFEPGTIYKIQIQASKENIPVETIAKKMNISEKVTVEMTDGWYRYYVGSYTAYSAAKQNLESYRSRGLKDAFMCAFPNGVRQVIRN
ncbi:MAG: SPOR domain-containing protein [Bacteroidetes bacterium]|nr:SPOR domain-containing protein [Bacteroidota bacterium]